jgi:uncharacterized UBP type Zn finger protein
MAACSHFDEIGPKPKPSATGCEECLATGGEWVHLRICLKCGHVGCCESSQGRHASMHYYQTHHPLAQSHEPGEDWVWCYEHETAMQPR